MLDPHWVTTACQVQHFPHGFGAGSPDGTQEDAFSDSRRSSCGTSYRQGGESKVPLVLTCVGPCHLTNRPKYYCMHVSLHKHEAPASRVYGQPPNQNHSGRGDPEVTTTTQEWNSGKTRLSCPSTYISKQPQIQVIEAPPNSLNPSSDDDMSGLGAARNHSAKMHCFSMLHDLHANLALETFKHDQISQESHGAQGQNLAIPVERWPPQLAPCDYIDRKSTHE